MRHEQCHAHIFIRIGGTVLPRNTSGRTDMPIHHVIAVGIRYVLLGVNPQTIKQRFIRHHSGDQHAVSDTLGYSIIPIRTSKYTVTTRTSRRTGYPRIGHRTRVPSVVHGCDIALKHSCCFMIRFYPVRVSRAEGKRIIAGCRINRRSS
jgi:hypothetical protein